MGRRWDASKLSEPTLGRPNISEQARELLTSSFGPDPTRVSRAANVIAMRRIGNRMRGFVSGEMLVRQPIPAGAQHYVRSIQRNNFSHHPVAPTVQRCRCGPICRPAWRRGWIRRESHGPDGCVPASGTRSKSGKNSPQSKPAAGGRPHRDGRKCCCVGFDARGSGADQLPGGYFRSRHRDTEIDVGARCGVPWRDGGMKRLKWPLLCVSVPLWWTSLFAMPRAPSA